MKEILDLLKSFNTKEVFEWLKGYFLIWLKPKNFWLSIESKTNKSLFLQAFFYSVISGSIIFVFFFSGSNGVEIVKYLIEELFKFCCVVLPTLLFTAFIFSKRDIYISFARNIIYFSIFVQLLSYPIGFASVYLFDSLEETNFLFLHNLLSGPVLFIYLFFVSSFLFYKKAWVKLIGSLLNFLVVNTILFVIFNLIISSNLSVDKLKLANLDPIQKEINRLNRGGFEISTIPFSLTSYKNIYSHKRIKIWKNISIAELDNPITLKKLNYMYIDEKTDTLNVGKIYLDSLELLISKLDRFKNECKYEMNKRALASEINFYQELKRIMTNPIDTTDMRITYTFFLLNDNTTLETLDTIKKYIVLDKSISAMQGLIKEKNNYEEKFVRAYFPQTTIMKYLHFGLIN